MKQIWHDAKTDKPQSFDLVAIKTDSGKIIKGWYTGIANYWEGYRLRHGETVTQWARVLDYNV